MSVKTIAENSNKSGGSRVASMTLACLRVLRDCYPNEWEGLMKADKELIMVNLLDYLKEQQLS